MRGPSNSPVLSEHADNPAAVEALVTSTPEPRLKVDVYYECLCPDSRYFVHVAEKAQCLHIVVPGDRHQSQLKLE